jgi:hypothetical protein
MEHYANVLNGIHMRLPQIEEGQNSDEYVEQMMCVMALAPHDRVLELGGSIGRCSRVIASIVKPGHLVVLEPKLDNLVVARRNRDRAGLHYTILPIALSNVPLVWVNWRTYPFDPARHNESQKIATVPWSEFSRCHEPFNALVCDSEGALTKILEENPDFLDRFMKISIENDFAAVEEKERFEKMLRDRNFVCLFSAGTIDNSPGFYRVWLRQIP